jgi:uncharacterized protein YlxP (DUF503 family)
MVVGVCRLTLMVSESHSLKEKRMVLRRIKDRTRLKFNVAIAEVGDQDAWQATQIGFAVVANERGFVESMVDKIQNFIEQLGAAKIIDDEKDYVTYGEGEMSSEGWSHWEPDEPSPIVPLPGNEAQGRRGGRRERPRIPVRGARRDKDE